MCFKERKLPAWIVTGFSIGFLVCGIAMLIIAIVFETDKSIWTADLGTLTDFTALFRKTAFTIVLISSLLAIGLGIGGSMCMCKFCANCCAAVAFGIFLFFAWILFLVAGGVVVAIANMGVDVTGKICLKEGFTDPVQEAVATGLGQVDTGLKESMDLTMCSGVCKCDSTQKAMVDSAEESFLNGHGRTKVAYSSGLPYDSNGKYYFQWGDLADSDVFATYMECLASGASGTDASAQDTAVKLIGFFEGKYACSGICETPLFYATQPL
jgi:hypothetical protein